MRGKYKNMRKKYMSFCNACRSAHRIRRDCRKNHHYRWISMRGLRRFRRRKPTWWWLRVCHQVDEEPRRKWICWRDNLVLVGIFESESKQREKLSGDEMWTKKRVRVYSRSSKWFTRVQGSFNEFRVRRPYIEREVNNIKATFSWKDWKGKGREKIRKKMCLARKENRILIWAPCIILSCFLFSSFLSNQTKDWPSFPSLSFLSFHFLCN